MQPVRPRIEMVARFRRGFGLDAADTGCNRTLRHNRDDADIASACGMSSAAKLD